MADRSPDEDLAALVGELVRALRDLERELEPPDSRQRPPLPTPRELRRFASEVAIPGLILVLETNVRALRLLQRTLELGDEAGRTGDRVDDLRARATDASEVTLDRLDDALVELGRAIEGRPGNEEAAALLEEARALREEVQSRLSEGNPGRSTAGDPAAESGADRDAVQIDVEAELESIRDELDRDGNGDPPEEDDGSADSTDGGGDDQSGEDGTRPDGA